MVDEKLLDEAVREVTSPAWRAIFTTAYLKPERWLEELKLCSCTVEWIREAYRRGSADYG